MAKILVVASPPGPLTRERVAVGQQAGHEIFWLSTPQIHLPKVATFGAPAQTGRFGRTFLEPFILLKAIRRIQPDLIHVHYAWQGLRTPLLLQYRPMVITIMGGDILPEQSFNGWRVPFVKAMLNHADCITSKSQFLDGALCRIGDYAAKIKRVTWGVGLNIFRPDRDVAYLREQWHIPPGDLVFFDSRGAKPIYNKHIILAAFASYLRSGGPSATLLIATINSQSSYVAELRQNAQNLGIIDRVRFLGTVDHALMPDYYTLADVTISIPRSDGLPQTIFEALACGSFLILSDLPQYAGTVEDGVTARLVPANDSEAVATALAWIAARPEIRAQVAQTGRAYVQRYADNRTQARLVNQLYRELLENLS